MWADVTYPEEWYDFPTSERETSVQPFSKSEVNFNGYT